MNIRFISEDFHVVNSKPAILKKNKIYNNDISYGDLSDMIISSDYICHYCQKQPAKQSCPGCGKVFYCNLICRTSGTKTHEIFCKSFREKYTFRLRLMHENYEPHQAVKNFKGTKSKKELIKEKGEFLVKVQAGQEGNVFSGGGLADRVDDSSVMVYDKSRIVTGSLEHEQLFNLVRQFGKLGSEMNYSKRIYLNARIIKKDINHIQVRIDDLVHDQGW